MQPYARIQSVIELIEQVYADNAPADVIINNYMRNRRYIGSTDRREITESFYEILRDYWCLQGYLTTVGFSVNTTGQVKMGDIKQLSRLHVAIYLMKYKNADKASLEGTFNGEQFAPMPLTTIETLLIEKMTPLTRESLSEAAQRGVSEGSLLRFKEAFPETYQDEILHQNDPAPLDLRVNILKTTVEAVERRLAKEKIPFDKGSYSPWALRLKRRMSLSNHRLFLDGLIEIQDEGSQLISLVVDAAPGLHIWDYCAGAGGKTLAFAAMMNNKGRIIASDTLEWRLDKAPQRYRRAGIHNIECRLLGPENHKWFKRQAGKFDRVLVDVPCSGSGTWRRHPELKWRVTDTDLAEICQKQRDILEKAAPLVKPGGNLIYATCSLYGQENQDQIQGFLENHPEYSLHPITLPNPDVPISPEGYLQLSPGQHGTDGFFACVLKRKIEADEKEEAERKEVEGV